MANGLSQTLLDTVDAMQRAPSILKVKELLRSAASRNGFDFFFCAEAPSVCGSASSNEILFEEWPREWLRRYREERLFANDPVIARIQVNPDPFLWTDIRPAALSRAAARVMGEAASIGMRQGFVVPIFGVGGTSHGISFSGREPRCDSVACAELHLIAMYAYARAKRLRRREPEPQISITLREREAMQWAAAGKTDWEIGELLASAKVPPTSV